MRSSSKAQPAFINLTARKVSYAWMLFRNFRLMGELSAKRICNITDSSRENVKTIFLLLHHLAKQGEFAKDSFTFSDL